MAKIEIKDMVMFGALGGIESTTWEVYKADAAGQIIPNTRLFHSPDNKTHKRVIHATLRNEDGTLFDGEDITVAVATFKVNGRYLKPYIFYPCPIFGLPETLPYEYK